MAGSERHIKDVAKKHDQKAEEEEERRTVDRKLDEALEELSRALIPYRSAGPSRADTARTPPEFVQPA